VVGLGVVVTVLTDGVVEVGGTVVEVIVVWVVELGAAVVVDAVAGDFGATIGARRCAAFEVMTTATIRPARTMMASAPAAAMAGVMPYHR
jgi:hypothetical protein